MQENNNVPSNTAEIGSNNSNNGSNGSNVLDNTYTLVEISTEEIYQVVKNRNLEKIIDPSIADNIAQELADDYEPDWDMETAIDGAIDKWLERNHYCTGCAGTDIREQSAQNSSYPRCHDCGALYFGKL